MSNNLGEMWRSVAQLLYSYLPGRTVNWQDGTAIVSLGTPRINSAWPPSAASFVLQEIGEYLNRWKHRGGEVDGRFPSTGAQDRFTIGTPIGIAASLLGTALYCRECFRFLPRVRSSAERLVCPECNKQTLRQISYVFVHGCGELVPIKETIPRESSQKPGTLYDAPIRCRQCSDGGILRLDARSDRLSALRVYCSRCNTEVFSRPLARCPRCLARYFKQGAAEGGGQLAYRSAMRITRHSANNAYYAHSLTILRLDRPQLAQSSTDQAWLESLLPQDERAGEIGIASSLVELSHRLQTAERQGDREGAAALREQIARAALSPARQSVSRVARPVVRLCDDLLQSVRESVALLSTVRRDDVTAPHVSGTDSDTESGHSSISQAFQRLGIRRIELVQDLPVIGATFGFSRRSSDPTYSEEGVTQPFPTTLRPFPVLDQQAAQVLGRPQSVGTTPILAREGFHEGLAIYLDPTAVFIWLRRLGLALPEESEHETLGHLLSRLEPVDRFYEDIDRCQVRRLVFGLLHTMSHCAMKALSRTAGLETTGLSEYLFLPLLCTVVYSTATLQLGGVASTAKQRMMQFLDGLQEEAFRCIYDPDCLHRAGACHGCIHVPEIGCRVFNHGLSRSLLVGGKASWTGAGAHERLAGYWEVTAAS
jgi:ssDNA-binding Zn-finger/Zn-ribbon topoisomerase 1